MALAFVNIPVPAIPGVGAGVDVSGQNSILTVLNCFGAVDDLLVLEQSFNGGVSWMSLATPGNPQAGMIAFQGTLVAEVDAGQVRCRRLQGSGDAYNLHAIGQGNIGAPAAQVIAIPAAQGIAGPVDISGQPANLCLAFLDGATPDDFIVAQHSLDGVNYAPLVKVPGGITVIVQSGCNNLRSSRPNGGNAGNLRINGIPSKG